MRKTFLLLLLSFCLTACVANPPQTQPAVNSPTSPDNTPPPLTSTREPVAIAPATALKQVATAVGTSPAVSVTEGALVTQPPDITEAPAGVTVFPAPEQFHWVQIANGLEKPVGITNAGDGSGRLFVIEQTGYIRVIKNNDLRSEPFLDLSDRVGTKGFEQGLLGLAFHPRFIENGTFFVNYTDLQGDSVVSRFQVDATSPDRVDASREYQVLRVAQPFANHNGGGLAFGPDGYLYLGFGDGGSAGDPQGNAQNLDTLLGKLLRLDIDGEATYAIPKDNTFKDSASKGEIWAYGLRNPWRFSFDKQNGDLFIADVGQNMWEEINYLPAGYPAGANFGWNLFEGSHPYKTQNVAASPLIIPIFEYNHEKGCSVTGGVVYRGKSLPEFRGIYLFGDYCSGIVWGLMKSAQGTWQNAQLFEGMGQITSFGEDEQQEIYLVIHSGMVLRLERK